MADNIPFSSGGSLKKLAPDLNYPNERANAGATIKTINLSPTPGVPETALNLSGKWAVSNLNFRDLISEAVTIKLTIDGVVIWNAAAIPATVQLLLGSNTHPEVYGCNSSLLLEITTTTDTSCSLDYVARPIV
jgi:hypothetical protein